MKRANLITAVIFFVAGLFSADAFAETIIKDANGIEYLEDQIILKIKSAPVKRMGKEVVQTKRLMSLSEAGGSVQQLNNKWAVKESKSLFPHIVPPTPQMNLSAAKIAAKQRQFEKLGNTFLLKLPAGTDVKAAVIDFAEDTQVEYAEPVYVFRLCMIPNDPLFNQQWYLHNTGQYYLEDADIDAPEAWEMNQGSANPVIAIIDTGVDLDHPDLVNQIWSNSVEQPGDDNADGAPGWAGFDDDGDGLIDEDSQGRQPGEPGYNNNLVNDDDENGYNDDFLGWNWIDDHNNPQDDHGHGTHCAGIAAADTGNGIGIAGVCPNARIMPLKAFQSSGAASNVDIAKAIEYAYKNGADVISMSFTGPESSLIRDALELAYSTSVLVAAAGNKPSEGIRYPASYSYVIGVGASDVAWDDETSSYKEIIAGFTNTTNADIYAPGVSIRSTLLDDTYASWSGTSMATPVVAGIAGLLVSEKTGGFWGPDLYQGQLVNSREGPANRINAVTALTQEPEPRLVLESYIIDDSTGDGDGIPDANETIDLYFTIRNTYGNTTGVTATLSTSDVMATVTDPNAEYGNIGPSGSDDNTGDPITVHISPDAGNNRDIVFNFQADANNGGSGINTNIVLTVQRGKEVSGIIDTNTVWTADDIYILTAPIVVESGRVLVIEPGTEIRFEPTAYISVSGEIQAIGSKANPILFTGNQLAGPPSYQRAIRTVVGTWKWDGLTGCILKYCIFENAGQGNYPAVYTEGGSGLLIDRCLFRQNRGGYGPVSIWSNMVEVMHSLFYGNSGHYASAIRPGSRCIIENNTFWQGSCTHPQGAALWTMNNFTFVGNTLVGNTPYQFTNNWNVYDVNATGNFWGTTEPITIAQQIYDFYDNPENGKVFWDPYLTMPSHEAPAIVSNVEVKPSPPVGAGPLTITLTFSRPMDTNIPPTLSFGASEPYTQHIVTDGNWIDPNTWQGTYPVTLFTGDGLQTVRVSGAKDTDIGFEIPVDTRFGFEIDTAGLSGVNLQASGEAGRVDLYYNPVDEPDLAGYNVYRSDVSGGPFTKLNPAVVVEPNYSDYTAPPGITKYYVVTAVRTDFDESDYSDEAYAAALDGTPPEISHTPVADRDIVGPPGITIQATITDPGTGVAGATLYYKKTSEVSYTSLAMNNPSGDTWSENIPGAAVTLEGIDYCITAEDNSAYSGTAYHGTGASPHHIIIYTEKCGPIAVSTGASSQSYCTTDVTIDISANDAAGKIAVYRMEAPAPNIGTPTLQRYWAIMGLESSTFSADIVFSYTDGDLTAAGLDKGNLILRKSTDGGHRYQAVRAATDSVGNTIETANEQTSFSIWTINEYVCGDLGYLDADIDKDCNVDFEDFAILALQWQQAPGTPSADIAPEIRDDFVDMLDLGKIAEHWLRSTAP